MPRFRWSFYPKALAHTSTCYESNEPHDCGKLVTFFLRHHVVKVTYSATMSKKKTILSSSLDQRIEVLGRLDEAHRVEQGTCCRAGVAERKWHVSNNLKETGMSYWASGIRTTGLTLNTWCAKIWLTLNTSIHVLYNTPAVTLELILGLITIAYIIMTMHLFSMNIAGG